MKLKIAIILTMFFVSANFYSQTNYTYQDLINDKDYIEYENESIKIYNSDDFKKYNLNFLKFNEYLGDSNYDFEEDFNIWINKNLKSTNFSSEKEAIDFKNEMDRLVEIMKPKLTPINKKNYILKNKYGEDLINKAVRERILNFETVKI